MIISYTTKELDLLARIMRAEAQTEGDLGMLMVGNVVVNRVLGDCYTFKNIDNIKKTKYELFENLPLDGKAFFDVSNRLSSELSQKFNGEKYLANGNGELLSALDIKTTSDGTTFKITDGKEVV